MSMSVVMAFIVVNTCVTTPEDHTTVSVLMAMKSIVMAFHVQVKFCTSTAGPTTRNIMFGNFKVKIIPSYSVNHWNH